MEIEKALEYAQILRRAIVRDNDWGISIVGATVCENYTSKILMCSEDSKQFMNLLLNTFIDVQNSLSKSLEDNKDLQDAYRKYGEPFVHALQKSAEEHSHNFVQQWLDQHENDDKHLIDFGETKKRTVKIDPAGETPVDNDPEESEEGIPQIVINIDELNINLNV